MSAPIYMPDSNDGLVRQLVRRLRLFGGIGGKDHTTLDSPGGYSFVTSRDNTFVVTNAYFDGTNWNRYDTTQPAAGIYIDRPGNLILLTAAAGANPFTWTTSIIGFAKLSNALADGIVVATHIRHLYPLAGEAQYANAGTAWTALGGGIYLDAHQDLPAVATGATRRYRWVLRYNVFSTTGTGVGNVWLMHNGVPGVGTVRHAFNNLPHRGSNVATVHSAQYLGPYSGGNAPYNNSAPSGNSILQFYGQGPTGGGTLWVDGISLIAEDYIS